MSKIIEINDQSVRTVSFNGKIDDPYVIFHDSPGELSDKRLRELYEEWANAGSKASAAEADGEMEDNPGAMDFENYLDWLENNADLTAQPSPVKSTGNCRQMTSKRRAAIRIVFTTRISFWGANRKPPRPALNHLRRELKAQSYWN